MHLALTTVTRAHTTSAGFYYGSDTVAYELAEHVKIRQPGMAMRRARARASRARWEVMQTASQEQAVHSPCRSRLAVPRSIQVDVIDACAVPAGTRADRMM